MFQTLSKIETFKIVLEIRVILPFPLFVGLLILQPNIYIVYSYIIYLHKYKCNFC
jgi:hypothetical protein